MVQCSCVGLKLLHKSPEPLGVTSYLQYFPSNPLQVFLFFFFSFFLPTAIELGVVLALKRATWASSVKPSRVKSARSLSATSTPVVRPAGGFGRRREVQPPHCCRTAASSPSQKATTCYKFSLKRLLRLILIVAAKFTARWPGAGWRKTDYFLLLFFFFFLLTSSPLPVREFSHAVLRSALTCVGRI